MQPLNLLNCQQTLLNPPNNIHLVGKDEALLDSLIHFSQRAKQQLFCTRTITKSEKFMPNMINIDCQLPFNTPLCVNAWVKTYREQNGDINPKFIKYISNIFILEQTLLLTSIQISENDILILLKNQQPSALTRSYINLKQLFLLKTERIKDI